MPRTLLAALIFCLVAAAAGARPDSRLDSLGDSRRMPWPGEQCRAAIAAAERAHGIPAQLMAAIGRVESGKRDPGTGVWGAWPWTINAEGQGAYFETKADAIKAVMALQASGVRSIDVGCMQVNLKHHPNAFPNLDMAFEPSVNAEYAAQFLLRLYGQTNDWNKTTANYHSANPWEGEPYAAKVNSVWPEEQRKAGLMPPPLGFAASGGMPFRGIPFASRMMPFGRLDARFPVRAPPPMFPLNGMMPGVPPRLYPGARLAAGALPLGMMQAGALPSGPASGQDATNPGRGLAFYRAAPVAVRMPIRQMVRIPYRLSLR